MRDSQPLNARNSIEVTDSGIVISVRAVQPLNARHLIEVTDSGIVILVRDLQPSNAPAPIEVTESGIVTSELFPLYFIRVPSFEIIKSERLSEVVAVGFASGSDSEVV